MQDLQDIDIEATCALWHGKEGKQTRQLFPTEEGDDRWLAKVLTGSFRPASRLFKAKVLPSPICPFCDTGEEVTKEHCFWRCPRWTSIRAEAIHFLQQEGFQMEKPEDPNPTRSGTPALWWCGLMNEDPVMEEALGERAVMYWLGSARAPDLPVTTFIFLAMVWYSIEI